LESGKVRATPRDITWSMGPENSIRVARLMHEAYQEGPLFIDKD